ncbi:MAG: PAS-domain containing protein [Rhodobacteraceae bacterium]|nr:PAS-domain containing protein [Paracoccaceae bacterium]
MAQDMTQNDGLMQAGLNLIQQALSIYDHDLKLAVCNSRFREMFSLPDHLTRKGAAFSETIRYLAETGEYGAVDDLEAFVGERVAQARDFVPHYMERRRSNGRMISVEGNPLRQGGWVTVYTDITDIKRQEALLRSRSEHLSDQLLTHSEELARTNRELAATIAALEQAKRDLTDSEALTRTTTEMMPAHIAHLDLDQRYTYSNRKLPSILPDRAVDITGMYAPEALGDEAYAAIRPWLERAYAGEASVFEFNHAGAARRIRTAFTPETGPHGVTGVYVLSMDITEEAQARAALAQSHKRELAAQLTSGLAHDFANLLTIILGLQGRLEKLEALPDQAREMIATTRAAALRGGVLLDRLSNIAGPRRLNPVATDIATLLGDIRALATPSLPEGVALNLSCSGLARPVLTDAGFLQDSLLNLVLNARDAIADSAEAGGVIDIRARNIRDLWLEFTVTDTGPGFTGDALQHALDPFYTTKRNESGSGLGLSMVYDFAQLSGGHLKIANRDCGGASVELRLPVKWGAQSAEPRLVLLVEDDPDIRANIRAMLRDLGHAVIESTNADEAEALADIPGIDMVLSDITLDGSRTGLDLALALAERPSPPRLFMMTSLPPANPLRVRAAASFPLIAKPFSPPELAQILATEHHA